MQNVYDPRLANEIQIGRFPDHRQHYVWEPVVDAGGPDRRAVFLFHPTTEEAVALLQGGSVRVVVEGVVTPPKILVETDDLGRESEDIDDVAARVLYDAAGGHPLPWEDAGEDLRALYRERATALWRVFVAQHRKEGA